MIDMGDIQVTGPAAGSSSTNEQGHMGPPVTERERERESDLPANHQQLVEAVHQVELGLRRTMLRRGSDALSHQEVTLPQLRLLLELDQDAPVSPLELASRLHLSASTVTATVDRLVQRGLVTREEDPQDRRRKRLDLTSQGADLMATFTRSGLSSMLRVLEHLTDAELRDLLRLLRRMEEIDRALTPSA